MYPAELHYITILVILLVFILGNDLISNHIYSMEIKSRHVKN